MPTTPNSRYFRRRASLRQCYDALMSDAHGPWDAAAFDNASALHKLLIDEPGFAHEALQLEARIFWAPSTLRHAVTGSLAPRRRLSLGD